ncbi:pentapeptide repeat family protein [Cutibacterium acnes HL099PA1]|nr:pentapeptide repeat family protein [Cutibacterium acnes HL099PA1]
MEVPPRCHHYRDDKGEMTPTKIRPYGGIMNREEVLAIVAAAHKNNTRADLCGVSLHDVDLSNANLTGADLRGAKLSA